VRDTFVRETPEPWFASACSTFTPDVLKILVIEPTDWAVTNQQNRTTSARTGPNRAAYETRRPCHKQIVPRAGSREHGNTDCRLRKRDAVWSARSSPTFRIRLQDRRVSQASNQQRASTPTLFRLKLMSSVFFVYRFLDDGRLRDRAKSHVKCWSTHDLKLSRWLHAITLTPHKHGRWHIFLLRLLFDPEGGGDMVLRRQHSSQPHTQHDKGRSR
jgi:hypothetical protein